VGKLKVERLMVNNAVYQYGLAYSIIET